MNTDGAKRGDAENAEKRKEKISPQISVFSAPLRLFFIRVHPCPSVVKINL